MNKRWVQISVDGLEKKSKINKRAQPAITCSKLTIETLEQGVKYVQS